MRDPVVVESDAAEVSSAHFVHTLLRFALAVRQRRQIVFTTVLVATLLGGLYFLTAPRRYAAKAGLLVSQVGNDYWSPTGTQRNLGDSVLPTYEKLISSPRVIEGAILLLQPEDRIDLAGLAPDKWSDEIQDHLDVRSLLKTNILEVTYRSRDPHAAVAVVNAIVKSYLELMNQTYKTTANDIIQVLSKERLSLAQQIAAKQQELLQAQQALGAMGIPDDSRILHPVVQRAISINDKLIEARSQRVQLEAIQAALQAAMRKGENLQEYLLAVQNVVGEQILLSMLGFNGNDTESQSQLERDLFDCRTQLQSLGEHLGAANPRVVELQTKIRTMEQYQRAYQDRIRQRFAQLQDRELGPLMLQMLQQRLAQGLQLEAFLTHEFELAQADAINLNGRMVTLDFLGHDLKRLQELHDTLLTRIAGLDLKQDGLDVRLVLIDEPVINTKPVSPKLLLTLCVTLFLGLGSGLLVIYLLDALDDHFRSLEELQAMLGVPVLAMIQRLSPSEVLGVEALQIVAAPEAAESEAFRTLRTAISLSSQETRRLVVSSAEPGDGKTTVLANLAAAFAQAQKKTLLIDADLRRPGLTAALGLRGSEGLSTILRGEDDVARLAAAYIQASGVQGLDLLPAGLRTSNPAELLATARFAELLAWAEGIYDQILIDSPPALATSDTAVIGRLVDGVLLVVQPDKNHRRTLTRTVESLSLMKIAVLGVVINRVESGKAYYYGYGYNYGYNYRAVEEPVAPAFADVLSDPIAWPDAYLQDAGPSGGIVPRRAA